MKQLEKNFKYFQDIAGMAKYKPSVNQQNKQASKI